MTQNMASGAASILHEHNASQMLVHRGSVKGRSKNMMRNRVEGHLHLHKDYFNRTAPVFTEKFSRGGAGYQRTYSWSFYGAS
jgi:hypothetical protein